MEEVREEVGGDLMRFESVRVIDWIDVNMFRCMLLYLVVFKG